MLTTVIAEMYLELKTNDQETQQINFFDADLILRQHLSVLDTIWSVRSLANKELRLFWAYIEQKIQQIEKNCEVSLHF